MELLDRIDLMIGERSGRNKRRKDRKEKEKRDKNKIKYQSLAPADKKAQKKYVGMGSIKDLALSKLQNN